MNSSSASAGYQKLIQCPNCNVNLPMINLKYSFSQIEARVNCLCSNSALTYPLALLLETYNTNKMHRNSNSTLNWAKSYCLQCLKWVDNDKEHFYKGKPCHSTTFSNILCLKHNQSFNHYCYACKSNQCANCKCRHSDKKPFFFKEIDVTLLKTRLDEAKRIFIRETGSYNQIMACYVNKDFQRQINNFLSLNKALIAFYELLYCTTLSLLNYPTYQLIKLIRSFEVNTYEVSVNRFKCNLDEGLYVAYKCDGFYKINYEERDQEESSGYCCFFDLIKEEYVIRKPVPANHYITAHEKPIRCVLALQDGKIASSSEDNTIQIWDADTMNSITILPGKADSLLQLKDGRLVSSSSDDCTMTIWDLHTNHSVTRLSLHSDGVISLLLLGDRQLVSLSKDRTVRVWNVNTFKSMGIDLPDDYSVLGTLVSHSKDSVILNGSSTILLNVSTADYSELVFKDKINPRCLIHLESNEYVFGSEDQLFALNIETMKPSKLIKTKSRIEAITRLSPHLIALSLNNKIRIRNLLTARWDYKVNSFHLAGCFCFVINKLVSVNSSILRVTKLDSVILDCVD